MVKGAHLSLSRMLRTEAQEKEFLEKVYRRSHSDHSRRYYEFGIRNFSKFCADKGIAALSQQDICRVLDDYVNWLDKRGTKPKSIADCMSAVRRFLGYLEIEVDPVKFRANVTMPRVTLIDDKPININELRLVLAKGRATQQMRALVFTLISSVISSGMRIGEALSIRVSDLNLQMRPATIQIKPEYSKTRTGRVAYISDEARSALDEIIKGKARDEFVFPYIGDKLWIREKHANRAFRRMVERAGFNDLIEGHRIHKLHFHNFRKFFLTKGSDTIGEHAAYALCGHGFFLDTYYQIRRREGAGLSQADAEAHGFWH
jgi:integrase